MSMEEFERWAAGRDIAPEELPDAFAQWLANQTGAPVVGRSAREDPTVVAVPEPDE
jgi:hypothetical protein